MKVLFKTLTTALLILVAVGCYGLKSNPRHASAAGNRGSSKTEESETNDSNKKNRRRGSEQQPDDEEQDNAKNAIARFENFMKEQINIYMGVPYRWGGTSSSGMDCSGFVSVVYKKAADQRLPHSAARMYRLGTPVPRKHLVYGDLVFFENISGKGVSHVGIYVGNGKFAHASTSRGVIVSGLNEDYYKERYIGARRVFMGSMTSK